MEIIEIIETLDTDLDEGFIIINVGSKEMFNNDSCADVTVYFDWEYDADGKRIADMKPIRLCDIEFNEIKGCYRKVYNWCKQNIWSEKITDLIN